MRAGELGNDGMEEHLSEGRLVEDRLDKIAHRDDSDKAGNHDLEGAKSVALETEDEKCRDRGQDARCPQRDSQQEVEAQGSPEELSEVSGHGHDLRQDPEEEHERLGETDSAMLGKIPARGDSQLCRKGLDEHGDEIAGHYNPEESESELRPALDVGGEVAWIHVGHARDESRAHEGQDAAKPSLFPRAGKDPARSLHGTRVAPSSSRSGGRRGSDRRFACFAPGFLSIHLRRLRKIPLDMIHEIAPHVTKFFSPFLLTELDCLHSY